MRDFVQSDHGSVSNGIKNIIVYFFRDGSEGFMDVWGFGDVVSEFPCALVGVFLVINFVHFDLIMIEMID